MSKYTFTASLLSILTIQSLVLSFSPGSVPFHRNSYRHEKEKGCFRHNELIRLRMQEEKCQGYLNHINDKQLDRRSSFVVLTGMLAAITVNPSPSAAASYPQAETDKNKIVQGYKRLSFLLDNWEKETTVCKRNDNPYLGCDRTPEKVMEYLGYKSMNDPLFRADKTMIRLQVLVPDSDKQGNVEFQDAIDTWMEKAEEGNGLAYISSWGEANPGGGKDRVALFLERSKKDVVEARQCLATIIRVLDLKVD